MTSLIIDRETLLKPLQAVSGIVERRQTLPILSNVLIEVRSGVLSLTATDLEIQVSATAPGLVNLEDFSITVAARKLSDILRALPEQRFVIMAANATSVQWVQIEGARAIFYEMLTRLPVGAAIDALLAQYAGPDVEQKAATWLTESFEMGLWRQTLG
jgi:hypothetical protein